MSSVTNILNNIKNISNRKLFEVELTKENIESLQQKQIVVMCDDTYEYCCYRVGYTVSLQASGKHFGNCGSHGVYEYSILSGEFNEVDYIYQEDHVKHILEKEIYDMYYRCL